MLMQASRNVARGCAVRVRMMSAPSFDELVAKRESKNPSYESIRASFKDYPEVQDKLAQVENFLADVEKDHEFEDLLSKHRLVKDSSEIDWDYAKEMLGEEVVSGYEALIGGLEEKLGEYSDNADYFAELKAHTEKLSAEVREQNAGFQKQLPDLEKELARTEYLLENIEDVTLEDEMKHEPAIFAEIAEEQEQHHWDEVSMKEDPLYIAEQAGGDKHH